MLHVPVRILDTLMEFQGKQVSFLYNEIIHDKYYKNKNRFKKRFD